MNSLINCSHILVKQTKYGIGAFATKKFYENEVIEEGIIKRIITTNHKNPYLFKWKDENISAYASGCFTFYNTSLEPNSIMIKNYDLDSFKIIALHDIEKGVELTRNFNSLQFHFHDGRISMSYK
jgi:hypothetical protein